MVCYGAVSGMVGMVVIMIAVMVAFAYLIYALLHPEKF